MVYKQNKEQLFFSLCVLEAITIELLSCLLLKIGTIILKLIPFVCGSHIFN